MRSHWYRDGLKFQCSQCGNCCTKDPGYVWVTKTEIAALAKRLKLTVDEFGQKYLRRVGHRYSLIEKSNFDCIFWDGGCTVYEARPKQCRTFPFWSENLRSRRAWEEEAVECPGMGEGALYTFEEIQVIRRGDGEASES